MLHPYCEKFDFDANKIAERLQWLELSAADHATAKQLQQEVIQPNTEAIVDAFYAWLPTLDEARALLADDELVKHLRQTQTQYLLNLGIDFDQTAYFESRLRVGQAHVWVGLSLSLYQCSYRYFSEQILRHIDPLHKNAVELTRFVHKIISLDMSLAIETYHLTQVRTLEELLARSKSQQKTLRMAAATDSLTGLANHETILTELERALQQPPTKNHPVVAIMADIDHFKQINDTHGHLTGDKVLVETTRRIQSALRDFDDIGRYGGEEFLLVLSGSNLVTATAVAKRIREHVGNQPINLQGLEVPVTISLGVAAAHEGEAVDELVARADKALYAAKAAGRNCVIVSDT